MVICVPEYFERSMEHIANFAVNSSPSNNNNSTNSSRILYDVPCKVCGDYSSGKHYGIFACDGCAGFFKRSIRRGRDYPCKGGSASGRSCLVDKTHRNQCRGCRLKRCLEVGMNRDAVQHERGPRTATIRKQMELMHGDKSAFPAYPFPHASLGYSDPFRRHLTGQHSPSESVATTTAGSAYLPVSPAPSPVLPLPHYPLYSSAPNLLVPMTPPISSPATTTCMTSSPIKSSASSLCDSPPLPSTLTPPLPAASVKKEEDKSSESSSLSAICETAARLLFQTASWARSLPSFACLPATVQEELLSQSWVQLFILSCGYYIKPADIERLVVSKDNKSETAEDEATGHLKNHLQRIMANIHLLELDYTELTCLRALLLFRGSPEVQGPLASYLAATRPAQPYRLGSLLLAMSSLNTVSVETVQEVFFKSAIGTEVPLQRIVVDMIKSAPKPTFS